jgi:hypothetical protein
MKLKQYESRNDYAFLLEKYPDSNAQRAVIYGKKWEKMTGTEDVTYADHTRTIGLFYKGLHSPASNNSTVLYITTGS